MTDPSKPTQAVYWSCADLLCFGAQLARTPDVRRPDELRQHLGFLLEEMGSRCLAAGLSRDDIEDVRYAVVAFLDEQVLQPAWHGRAEWQRRPLQLEYFDELTAGEGFFARLKRIETRAGRAHVLQIYHLCLALGFKGMYALRDPGALSELRESLGLTLRRALPSGEDISPHGMPPDLGRGRKPRRFPALALALGALAVVIGLSMALRRVQRTHVDNACEDLRAAASAQRR